MTFKLSYLSDFHLPWLKSSNPTFKLAIDLLRPGLYLLKEKWYSHGFLVSMTEGKISFALFLLRYAKRHFSNTKRREREMQTSLSMEEFLLEFLDKYTFYAENTINVYDTIYHGYIFINHLKETLLFDYEDLYYLNGNEYNLHFGYINETDYNITVGENRVVEAETVLGTTCYPKEKLEPVSFESYLANGESVDYEECVCTLEFDLVPGNRVSIRKEGIFCRACDMEEILSDSPNIYKMLTANKPS